MNQENGINNNESPEPIYQDLNATVQTNVSSTLTSTPVSKPPTPKWLNNKKVMISVLISTVFVIGGLILGIQYLRQNQTDAINKTKNTNSSKIELTPEIIQQLGKDIAKVNPVNMENQNPYDVEQIIKQSMVKPLDTFSASKNTNIDACNLNVAIAEIYIENFNKPTIQNITALNKYVDTRFFILADIESPSGSSNHYVNSSGDCVTDSGSQVYDSLTKKGNMELLSTIGDFNKIDKLTISDNDKKIYKYAFLKNFVFLNFLDKDFFEKYYLNNTTNYSSGNYYKIEQKKDPENIWGYPRWNVKLNLGDLKSDVLFATDNTFTIAYIDKQWVVM